MTERVAERLRDIEVALSHIETLLAGKSLALLAADPIQRAAFERFLEIVSEASRHVPQSMQDITPEIDWKRLRGLGNILRHAYNRVDPEVLWNFYETGQLAELRQAVLQFIENTTKRQS